MMAAKEVPFCCCIHHPECICDFHCKQCNQDVCKECISSGGEHAQHQCQSKETIAKEFRQRFEKELSDILVKKETLKQLAKSLQECESMLKQNSETACEKIARAYDDIIQVVENKKKDDIKRFREKYEKDAGLKELGNLMGYVNHQVGGIESIERRESQHENSSSDILFMESRKDIDCEIKETNELLNRQMDKLSQFPHRAKPDGKTATLGSGLTAGIQEKVSTMYRCADPQKTTVQSVDIAHAGEATSVTVILKDSDGNPCLVPQEIHVELQSVRQPEAVVKAVVNVLPSSESLAASEYIAEYTPTLQTRGHCMLKVWFDSDHIQEHEIYVDCPHFIERPCKILKSIEAPGCLHRIGNKIFMIQGNDSERCIKFIDTSCSLNEIQADFSVFKAPEGYKHWRPIEMASSENNVYVTDSKHNMVHMFTHTGEYVKSVGGPGRRNGKFKGPNGLCVTNDSIYVCDSYNHRIQVFDHELNFMRCFGSEGSKEGQFRWPSNVAFEEKTRSIFVTELKNNRLQCLTECGDFLRYIGSPGSGSSVTLIEPNILLIANNYLYVTDRKGVYIFKISEELVTCFATMCVAEKEKSINGFAIDEDGYRYVSDDVSDRIVIF